MGAPRLKHSVQLADLELEYEVSEWVEGIMRVFVVRRTTGFSTVWGGNSDQPFLLSKLKRNLACLGLISVATFASAEDSILQFFRKSTLAAQRRKGSNQSIN